ncbi:MAG TPA: hypothetical protein VIJ63_00500, partial [Roseiarcus sp.]
APIVLGDLAAKAGVLGAGNFQVGGFGLAGHAGKSSRGRAEGTVREDAISGRWVAKAVTT